VKRFVVLLKRPNLRISAEGWKTDDRLPDRKPTSNVIYRVAVEAPSEEALLEADILGGATILSIREVTPE
jgi:hypothetical protein